MSTDGVHHAVKVHHTCVTCGGNSPLGVSASKYMKLSGNKAPEKTRITLNTLHAQSRSLVYAKRQKSPLQLSLRQFSYGCSIYNLAINRPSTLSHVEDSTVIPSVSHTVTLVSRTVTPVTSTLKRGLPLPMTTRLSTQQ